MRVNRYIVIRPDEHFDLINYVKENNISFDEDQLSFCFNIFDDDARWPFIRDYAKKESLFVWTEAMYSEQELETAEWMRIRSAWHFGYSLPLNNFWSSGVTYDDRNKCSGCESGYEQTDSFRIQKTPKWGNNKYFGMLYGHEDILFVNEKTKNILQNCSGVSFMRVKDKKGNDFLENIYQVVVLNKLPEGIINKQAIAKELSRCGTCGSYRILYNELETITFKRETFDNACDFMNTSECFGNAKLYSSYILINQQTYQLIKKNKLDRGLIFKPIKLI